MTKRKIPLRQCISCRQAFDKRELMRVVRSPEGEVSIDHKGRMAGRGAYICRNTECIKRAVKTKALERALSSKIPDAVYEEMLADVITNE